ncbi:polyketide cyclase / dehydrase and lipid transport [Hirsutella rhossiliensis]|uniref:Polyketide cyclase / dehydrase and lipid transport domain-containing protein n=1 Tax=Hirsutella rhossiliensis TaxID=111463 RepID=A0A9P8N2V3_9HYPO|nr:polyketide cyclase / dehydrase and lipid transport domain-containing protein [Hirsutella rhossiliensis]KAH0964844.1 polyketide cyclase / dehydrase and lipid transport domain-containing protein [Hirsutella rhossiliensis]
MSLQTILPRRLPSRPSLLAIAASAATAPRRSFFNLPGGDGSGSSDSNAQHLTATRTLPYASAPLYDLIADVDSYHRFVPYCARSRVTHWSPPDAHGRRWPAQADLHVGWGGFTEVFTSRLRCVPGVSVEALSRDDESASSSSSVFKSLVTRWSLNPVASHQPSTEVHLSITYQFTSPIYAAVSAAVSDKVAGVMIEAFEKQAQERLASTRKL